MSLLHPCALGDLLQLITLKCAVPHLGLDERAVTANWKSRYPWATRLKAGLYIDVQAANAWLDARVRSCRVSHHHPAPDVIAPGARSSHPRARS